MSARRRPRERVVLDADSGKPLAGFWSDMFGPGDAAQGPPDLSNSDFPEQLTSDPNVHKQVVPTGTPRPYYVAAYSIGFPNAYYDTWYFPTSDAYSAGRTQAAIDTIVATGDQIGAVVTKVADVGANIAGNLGPIIVGLIALVLLLKFGGDK